MRTTQQLNQPNNSIIPRHSTTIFSFLVCLFALYFAPCALVAADFAGSLKSVSITDSTGTNQPPVAVINYTQNGDTFTFDASGSSDPDGSIVEYKWDFGDDGTSGISVTHQFPPTGEFPVSLNVIDNDYGVHVVQQIVRIEQINIAINFQPANATIPNGYLADVGGSFDSAKGFGWTIGPEEVLRARDRDSSLSTGQEYDTLISVASDALWEYEVPNGSYMITICVGDANYPIGIQRLQAEGVSVIDAQLSDSVRWVTKEKVVDVRDGKVSITFVGSGENAVDPIARLCWVKIQSN